MRASGFDLASHLRNLELSNIYTETGRVKNVMGPIVHGTMIEAPIGGVCYIDRRGLAPIEAEIVGFHDSVATLMPLEATDQITMGAKVRMGSSEVSVRVDPDWVGKVLGGDAKVIQTIASLSEEELRTFHGDPSPRRLKHGFLGPHQRDPIRRQIGTGVRALDLAIPFGEGQRLALMAASGVGKSMLMSMIAKNAVSDVNVIALVGERGREVGEFVEHALGPEGMKKSIVIAVTSDQSPVLKVRGAYLATTIAEFFRDQGKRVFLMMDSVTRFAMALREVGLSAGEPPTTKGYTPSVFSQLPRLLERAGNKKSAGSITALYTVLVEGNDMDDPIADAVRSIVDGHIVLDRALAHKGHYPAIDILSSVSRLDTVIFDERKRRLNRELREQIAIYREAEDLLNIGGYRIGTNAKWDRAIQLYPQLTDILRQSHGDKATVDDAFIRLEGVLRG